MDTRHAITFVPLAALAACGGGGSGSDGGAITGLAAPAQMEIVTINEPMGSAAGVAPSFSADSDYATDAASVHVYDPAIEPVQMVNEILCYIEQLGAAQMVNRGPYNAQIDEARCQSGSDPSSAQTGQSSGANAGAPSLWVVESSRSDNRSPQAVHVWVPEDEEGFASTIFVDMSIQREPSASDPFGAFELDFAGAVDELGLSDPLVHGALQTADSATLGFDLFFEHGDVLQVPEPGDGAEQVAVKVAMAADQSSGQARVKRSFRYNDPMTGDSGPQTEEYLLDFDEDEVLRELVGGPTECLSRTAYSVNTHRYNLYHAAGPDAGARVEIESGFQIRTQDGAYGQLGYWGLWLPSGSSVANGDVVERVEFGSSQTQPYVLVIAPGKLIEHVRNTLPLVEAEGLVCEWWDGASQPQARYQVEVAGGLFLKVAAWDEPSQAWMPLGSPEALDTATLGFLNMYSQTLGGSVGYVHGDPFLTYFATSFVNGSSELVEASVGGNVELYGFVQCLRSDITASEAEAGNVYLPDALDVGSPHSFEFHGDDLTLYHDVDGSGSSLTQVGLADGQAPQSGPYVWGLRSGPLVTDPSGLVQPWDVWNQDVFYVYETGPNPWNVYTSATDVFGASVAFDPPIQFTYTHAMMNDANGDASYDGARVLMSYGGPGDLWGIPSTGVDFDGDGIEDRFFPAFSIADGVVLGPSGVEYVIRGLESELTLLEVPGGGATLDTARAAALVLPDESIYATPAIGAQPGVSAPPAVIEGVVQ